MHKASLFDYVCWDELLRNGMAANYICTLKKKSPTEFLKDTILNFVNRRRHISHPANDEGYPNLQPRFVAASIGCNLSDRFSFRDVRLTFCSSRCGHWADWQNVQLFRYFVAYCPSVAVHCRDWAVSLYTCKLLICFYFPSMLQSMQIELNAGWTLLHVSCKNAQL